MGPTCPDMSRQHFSKVDEVLLPDAVELCLPQAVLGSVSWLATCFLLTWNMSHIESL